MEDAGEFGPSGFFGSRPETPFLDTLITLRKLGRLDDVAGVLLSLATDELGWAQATELRQAILDLRAAGKRVYVWLPVGDTRTYAIATAADAIYTAPSGGVLLTGIRAELTYLGKLLENLGITAEFVAIGAFKSAPETFTEGGPSDASRRVEDALLDDLYAHVVRAIAEGRKLPDADVRALIDRGPYTAREAKEAGLVDGVIHYDEFERVVREDFGVPMGFTDADRLLQGSDPRWGIQPAIGVLYAVGTITDGRSTQSPFGGTGSTGAETFVRATRAMREDGAVKAVVLRIDSPGGSVTAADAMWRELSRLAEEKPLIVSMGDVAASGGYYIAAPAREILALPETVTGSIGIFTGKFDLSEGLGRLGIHREVFTRGRNAAILSSARRWTEAERDQVERSMRVLYDLFISRVAEGRKSLSIAEIEPLAGGRVWTGAQARACGLVDRPAGFLAAVDLAAREAGLAEGDYRLQVQRPEGGFGGLPTSPVWAPWDALATWLASPTPGVVPRVLEPLARLADVAFLQFSSGTPLALLPFEWR
ncbi:MAG: signal peptide peptidase SppA [bacterium]